MILETRVYGSVYTPSVSYHVICVSYLLAFFASVSPDNYFSQSRASDLSPLCRSFRLLRFLVLLTLLDSCQTW